MRDRQIIVPTLILLISVFSPSRLHFLSLNIVLHSLNSFTTTKYNVYLYGKSIAAKALLLASHYVAAKKLLSDCRISIFSALLSEIFIQIRPM